jgi:glutathione S-transferase
MLTQTKGGAVSDDRPILIQLDISHYSEKIRWALDRKQVPHVRRSPLPGTHIPIAFALTGGESVTLPLLRMAGRTIADSTAILAAIEERYPEPALYPADPDQRRRALELEDFFDEELGPHARLLPFHELSNEPAMFAEVAAEAVPGPLGKAKGLVGLYARTYAGLRFGVRDAGAAAVAREKIVAALDRLEAELEANGGGEFLVGESFSVADLTAASLFYPVVGPDEGPLPADSPTPPRFEAFRKEIDQRPGYLWVEETFRRHRYSAPVDMATAASS